MPIESNIIRNNNTGSAVSGQITSSKQSQAATNTSGTITGSYSLYPGQIVKGEITDIRGKEVTISLEDNSTIVGQFKDISNLYIGQTTAFRVADISPKLVMLESLLGDLSNQENLAVRKALDEAELPHTQRNTQIVQELLRNRMPINKATIMDMIKQVSSLNDTSVDTVVLMNKYGIPTNQSYATQFQSYVDGSHSFIRQIDSLSEGIPSILEQLANNADAAPVTEFGNKLMSIMSDHIKASPSITVSADVSTFSGAERNELVQYINDIASSIPLQAKDTHTLTNITAQIADGTASVVETDNYIKELTSLIESNTESKPLPEVLSKLSTYSNYVNSENNTLGSFMEADIRTALVDNLKTIIPSETILQSIKEGTINANALFTAINNNLQNSAQASAELFTSRPFIELFRNVIRNAWTLTPRELRHTDNITDYYRQLMDDLTKTTELIKNNLSGSASQSLTASTSGMQDNINFMQELNQMFSFIQLPIKLQEHTIHSDLYVYTKKDEIKRHPEKVSVLLHLDFDNLGSLDIHISKDHGRIDTTFSCPDETSANLIKTNMHMLEDTMNSMGYIFSANVRKTDNNNNLLQSFLEEAKPSEGTSPSSKTVNRYAFDLRA